jgi:small subunit ribosomal protein S2
MYKNFYNFNINSLIKIRLHLGHKQNNLNSKLTSYIYGTRHNINIYNLDKLWKPYRYLYYSLVQNFARRNSFFIIGTNKNLPMSNILEKLLNEYPFKSQEDYSFYISGYVDRKWIGGLFSNWKIFSEFIQYLDSSTSNFSKRFRYLKYFPYLKGIRNLAKMPLPDFYVFLDKDEDAFFELKKMHVPMIGLVDTDMDPDNFLYKFLGNNDTIENIEFFFDFIKETVKEGRLKEQQLFYYYFLYKLKKILNNQKVLKNQNTSSSTSIENKSFKFGGKKKKYIKK